MRTSNIVSVGLRALRRQSERLSLQHLGTAIPLAAALAACGSPNATDAPSGPSEDPVESCAGGKCDIWGRDGRFELYEKPDPFYLERARGVGVLVSTPSLELTSDGGAKIGSSVESLQAFAGLCSDVKFAKQPSMGECTGFFAGNDIFVTAGHCLDASDCRNTYVVFDYGYWSAPGDLWDAVRNIAPDSLYKCKAVLLDDYCESPDTESGFYKDVAIVRLDRPVQGRTPLAFRRSGSISRDQAVFQIGSPSGLPLKIAVGGNVKKVTSEEGFFDDLEMFGGNSGGPTFHGDTGEVEGVAHAYSAENWVDDSDRECKVLGVCGVNTECPDRPGAYPLTEYAEIIDAAIAGADKNEIAEMPRDYECSD